MIGSRLLSPSFHAAPWWGPQSGGPGPAKRRRIEEPAGPEDGMAPSLQGPQAADALTSVLVLAAGCALQLPLNGGVDLVLRPEPTSVLQVSLGGHTLVLVPEALLGPEPGALLGAPAGGVALQQGFFCAFAPHVAVPEEAHHQDEDAAPGFLTPCMVPAAGWVAGTALGPHPHGPSRQPWPRAPTPSPERRPPGPDFNLNFHLWERFPSSPLQALPPSASPGPQVRPRRPLGPAPKARKRLFWE
ncbi:proline-rich protein 23C-like [Myotis myotis]|uniref:Proline rich 23C n=1 Tax=Myotis myotis TaxID=51298 RepID=A0A7J7UDT3_MYOMY|nr:proline-rich protein 23C-like [Myotis myotis]KAF6311030.1 proline rich 23C [Myotis myotis]